MKTKAEIWKAFTPLSWGQGNTPQGDSRNGAVAGRFISVFCFLLSTFAL
jgi:hypothetical protein